MQIKLVVLDIAGTTVRDDDSVNRCLREALAAHGLVVQPAGSQRRDGSAQTHRH